MITSHDGYHRYDARNAPAQHKRFLSCCESNGLGQAAFCARPMCAPRCAVLCAATCSSLCSLAAMSPFARCKPTRTIEHAATTRNARSPCHVCDQCWARSRPRGDRVLWCPMHLDTGCGAAPLLSLCHRKPTCHRIGTGSLPNRQHPIELRLCDFRARRLVE